MSLPRMSGLASDSPLPTEIKLHQRSRLLEISFEDGTHAQLTHELLRVYSPSAEVRGHGIGQEILQTGKRDVSITAIEPVGNYAVKLIFDDGHDSGLYSWDHLHTLCKQHETLWAAYIRRMEEAGASREPGAAAIAKPTQHGCKH